MEPMESDIVISNEKAYADNDLMTVQEYASIKGCSASAVYQRITNGKLDSYLVMQDNRKLLLRQLLKDEGLNEGKLRFKDGYTPCQVKESFNLDSRLDRLESKIDSLVDIVKELNGEIQELKAEIQCRNNTSQALNEARTETKKHWWNWLKK